MMFWNASSVTARWLREGVEQPREESTFAFSRLSAVTALTAPQPGIEQIAHGIAEHVETVDDQRQEKSRPERQPGRLLHVLTPFPAQHTAPTGNLGGQPESEKAQRRLGNDDPANVDREDDDEGRHDIGQHMADQDLGGGDAHGFGCQKIVILFNADHRAADDSGAANATGDPQHNDDLEEPLSHDGHDGQQQQQPRKSHPGIDKALRSQVYFPSKESGSDADQGRDEHIERGRGQTDNQGKTRPVDDAAQEIPPQMVGPQQILEGCALQPVGQV